MLKRIPFVYYFLLIVSILFLFSMTLYSPFQQSAIQSFSWLHGRLDLMDSNLLTDTIRFNNKNYLTLGPFPSVLLLPFVAVVDYKYAQNMLQLIIIPLVFYLAFLLAYKRNFCRTDALYMSLAFCTGSVFCQVVFDHTPWFIAHSVVALFLLLSFWEYFNKNRISLIGIFLSFILATRPTACLAVLFFVQSILFAKNSMKEKAVNLFKLFFPMFIAIVMLMFFNYMRFGNIFETGYQQLADTVYIPIMEDFYNTTIPHKLFGLEFLSRNIVVYFLTPVKQGISLLDVSAFFVCLPFVFILVPQKITKNILMSLPTIFITLFILLCYYWSGWIQLGPRYLNDILPFLYLILLDSFKNNKINRPFIALAIVTTICNVSLLFRHYIFLP